jgi:hypothetical protein
VLEHPVAQGGGGGAGPAAQQRSAIRAGVALPDQYLGAQGPFQVPARPVQERLHLGRGQAEHEAQVHAVPGVQSEGLNLVGGQSS